MAWPADALGSAPAVRRDVACAAPLVRPFARWMLGREARALRAVAALPTGRARDGVPALLHAGRNVLVRTWIDGCTLNEGRPRDPAWFRDARRLLSALHRAGITHNDTAKEANWLVRPDGSPALVDFQLACVDRRRGRFFRLLGREDLRHLTKHKRTYCPGSLTPRERELLATPSCAARWLRAGPKRFYNLVTRGLLGWEDDEGARRRGNP
ncbi:MAG: serine/threonine protein kinase [Planctomycetota bacterium]